MSHVSLLIRPGERRDTAIAFAFLFAFVGSHTMLETARDALFLAKIPGTQLPWVYLAIAVVSFGSISLRNLLLRVSRRAGLVGWAAVSCTGTFALWLLVPRIGQLGLYVLYVWAGVLATLVLTQFWTFLGDLFSVTQAKRLYGIISMGAMAGAVAGSGAVSLFARRVHASQFTLFASAGFLVAALIPLGFAGVSEGVPGESHESSVKDQLKEAIAYVRRQPYAMGIVWLGLLTTVATTLCDFLFKTTVSASVAPQNLARMFGTTYLVLNVLSFGVQLVGVGGLMRRVPLPLLLAILPAGLALGGVGLAATGGIIAALAMKGVDGSMRYSLNRTATELLFVPLSESARRVVKGFIDIVGQRGGQVVASLLVLATTAAAYSVRSVAVLLTVTSLAAVVVAVRLRKHYVALFRKFVTQGRSGLVDPFAELDVSSLEALLSALDSESEDEVLASLRILSGQGKVHVIPALILYHPSERVVIASLRLFAQSGRRVAIHAIEHLYEHPSFRIRAEAIAARAVLDPDPEHLAERLSHEESPEVRAAIVSTMASFDMMSEAEARLAFGEIVAGDKPESKIVMAEVIAWRAASRYEDVVVELTRDGDAEVRSAAVRALGQLRGPLAGDALVDLLSDARTSHDARAALVALGESGAKALERALLDQKRTRAVRRQIPPTLADCDPVSAARVLLANLKGEGDGMVRYRSIVALQSVVEQNPEIKLDRGLLRDEIQATVARAYRYIDRRATMERGANEVPARATPGHTLLVDLLRDKERNATGRLFRLLALANPRQEFGAIYASIESGGKDHKANALELIENVLRDPLRVAVVGLVDDVDDEARLTQGEAFHEALNLGYEEVIAHTLASSSLVVRDLAAYHVGELKLTALLPDLERIAAAGPLTADIERTLAILGGTPLSAREGAPAFEAVHAG